MTNVVQKEVHEIYRHSLGGFELLAAACTLAWRCYESNKGFCSKGVFFVFDFGPVA